MKTQNPLITFLLILSFSFISSMAVADEYKIEHIQGDIYRFIDDRHRSVFLVTNEGIVLTDPLNPKAATWLKAEIKRLFNVPIKYVIYSHNHSDHIYGAKVFDDPDTIFIAHELAAQDIQITKADTVIPDVTFKEDMLISLGGHTIELRYHGPNDGRGSISMLFQPEKLLFVVDWIVIGRMPWQKLWSYDIQGMINSTQQVLDLDFDTFVGGHADIGNKSDVQHYLNYLQDLYDAVINGIHEGKSLDEIKQSVKLENYSDLKQFDQWLPLNIEGVYERLMEESGMGWRPDIK
ncbi:MULTISPECIES: MBL fold metallo-hydrolase [unclassified Neptuniibacter]|uniref:MBL fold metallo-hydrolase n=1 Tax=unclassified Neptuniibacter TaxID=2630693 RepID=UPI0026E142B3|nr:MULTISPECIES: MBL fold metallo-hydrolase [unclassified Neptuniibacter]MDO6512935.1 MBL fold metallo-hydrolase [Neptuniibacter sp. 2_MG-2023]MDO6592870.1 MBL fold metallo-hydrolase [Neptuniibacter sp. 1_MG-2023]